MWRRLVNIVPKKMNALYSNSHASRRIKTRAKFLVQTAFITRIAQTVSDQFPTVTAEEILEESDLNYATTEIEELQLNPDIEITFAESGEALSNLITTLHACIQEIYEQYQHCLLKQIEITLACMEKDPVGPHWDELTKYRVLADDLQAELVKYKTLISTIGSIVQNESFKGSEHAREDFAMIITTAYQNLMNLIEEKTKENHSWESKLLDVHHKSIFAAGVVE